MAGVGERRFTELSITALLTKLWIAADINSIVFLKSQIIYLI